MSDFRPAFAFSRIPKHPHLTTGFVALRWVLIVSLVVGRSCERADVQGTPVQFRDGPRRCNRVFEGLSNLLAIVA